MVAINFDGRFAQAVAHGEKRQTVRPQRALRRIVVGDKLQLYTGQRTKSCRKLGDGICIEAAAATIAQRDIFLHGRPLNGRDAETFARADGLASCDRMAEWFADKHGLPFTGVVIRWKKLADQGRLGEAIGVRAAAECDLPFVTGLGRQLFEAIGFVPKTRYEKIVFGEDGSSLHVAEANGDLVGFVYATHGPLGTKVQQCAVREDSRRLHFAHALVSSVIGPNDTFISARCAADLESAAFWPALGFEEARRSDGGLRRGRSIIRYVKTVGGLFVSEDDAIGWSLADG